MGTHNVSFVVFTDLDGALLDQETYSPHGAEQALDELRTRHVPLVFCSSKTRAEVEAVRSELDNRDPFIVENGGALFVPRGYFPFSICPSRRTGQYDILEWGRPYDDVVAGLRHAAELTGCPIRGFHEMTAEQLAGLCELPLPAAQLAQQREYDEPFEILAKSSSVAMSLLERLEEEDLTWTRGGRFYHVRGHHNKGQAAEVLAGLFRSMRPETVTVGFGDSPNDISLLEAVDVPILIPPPRKSFTHDVPHGAEVRVADQPGPQGWNHAILQLLNEPREALPA